MSEMRGTRALEAWAKQTLDGYEGVTIRNMTTSWRNGLAFCALIHQFRPDLITYDKLDPDDVLGNCTLAFQVAERELGIPALLEAEDMAACEIPDRLSVLTYVAQFYSTFKKADKPPRPPLPSPTPKLENSENPPLTSPSTIPSQMEMSSSHIKIEQIHSSREIGIAETNKQNETYLNSPQPSDVFVLPSNVNLFSHLGKSLPKQSDVLSQQIKPNTQDHEFKSGDMENTDTKYENHSSRPEEAELTENHSLEDEETELKSEEPSITEDVNMTTSGIEESEHHLEPPDTPSRRSKVRFLAAMIESNEQELPNKSSPTTAASITPSPILRQQKRRAPQLPPSLPPPITTSISLPPSPKPRTKFFKADEIRHSSTSLETEPTLPEVEATEIWKKENYYPAELNPFESEDCLTEELGKNPFEEEEENEPEKIKVEPTSGNLGTFLNPFEGEVDEEISNQPDQLAELTSQLRLDSSASSLTESITSGTESVRKSRKSHRAPLPPTLTSSTNLDVIPLISKVGLLETSSVGQSGSRRKVKKRRAPPPRRYVEPIPVEKITTELNDLEVKRGGLERQGIELENTIRERMKEEDYQEEMVEEMMIQLFHIVGEKNETVRRQTELEYLKRGHRLEERQAQLEFDLRILMETPEGQRKANHADAERDMLNDLISVVDERNEVVNWLDFHRRMDHESELVISKTLTSLVISKSPNSSSKDSSPSKDFESHEPIAQGGQLPDLVKPAQAALTERRKKEKAFKFFSLKKKKKDKGQSDTGDQEKVKK